MQEPFPNSYQEIYQTACSEDTVFALVQGIAVTRV